MLVPLRHSLFPVLLHFGQLFQLVGINPTTILMLTSQQQPVFSSGATDRSGDSDTESTSQDQWPFLYRIPSLVTASPVAI
jgi:hypothetical protein